MTMKKMPRVINYERLIQFRMGLAFCETGGIIKFS